jgi:hypothetical protein
VAALSLGIASLVGLKWPPLTGCCVRSWRQADVASLGVPNGQACNIGRSAYGTKQTLHAFRVKADTPKSLANVR